MRVVDTLRFALFPWRTCSGGLPLPAEEHLPADSPTTDQVDFVSEERTTPVITQRRLDDDLLFHFDVAPVIENDDAAETSPLQQRIESLTKSDDPYLTRVQKSLLERLPL